MPSSVSSASPSGPRHPPTVASHPRLPVRSSRGPVGVTSSRPPASRGDTLLHLDLRADNIVLTADRVYTVDWPSAAVGAWWVDVLGMAPSVAMQGGPRRRRSFSPPSPAPVRSIQGMSMRLSPLSPATLRTALSSRRHRASRRFAPSRGRRVRWRGCGWPNAWGGSEALSHEVYY